MPGRVGQNLVIERVRDRIGKMWCVPPGDIGFVSNVAEGVSMLCESIAWQQGDNICVDGNEYPSVVVPFALATVPEIRYAEGGEPNRILQKVDARTRMIAVSYVSYLNGERFNLAQLRAKANEVGAILVVDYTQAAGYLPIDASIADFAFSACYKWLLGITGCAVAYWNRARQPAWSPASAGWYSFAPGARGYDNPPPLREDALRFTRGNPAHASIYVLADALDYLAACDVRDLQTHVQGMTTAMLERLETLGIPTLTP